MATDHNFKVKNGLHVLGSEGVYLTDTNTRLHEGNGNALRITTSTGYIDIGSMNSGWVHFQANKNIYILPSSYVSVDGHLQPYSDGIRTLGANGTRWSHTYTDNLTVTDNVTIGGTTTATGQITAGYGLALTNGNTNFLLYNNTNDNLLYMRDTTNGQMLTTWYTNKFLVNKILDSTGDIQKGGTTVVDSSRNLVNIGTVTASGSITSGGIITGADSNLLRRTVSSWTIPTQTVVYSGYATNLGDYVYLKAPGNSTAAHGALIVGDNSLYYGRTSIETGGVTNSATAPLDESTGLRITKDGAIDNVGRIASKMGSVSCYSRPLLEITNGGTPTQIKITTNIPYSGTTHAHAVRISGFQYGSRNTADLQIAWHVYNNSFYNRIATSSGSWTPTITLAVENNKVVIHLASPGYWPKLYVESLYNAFGGSTHGDDWSWADAAISADSGTPNETVPYKAAFGNSLSMDMDGNWLVDSGYVRSSDGYKVSTTTVIDSARKFYPASLNSTSKISVLNGSSAQGIRVNTLYAGTTYANDGAASGQVDALNGYRVAGTEVIDSSRNLTNIGDVEGTRFRAIGADVTPAGTTFANAVKGTSDSRTIYFDGNGTGVSTWYGVGNNPFAAIDCTDGVMDFWVNPSNGSWYNIFNTDTNGITQTYGNRIAIDSSGQAYYRADGGTNQWKYLSLQTNGTTNWDIASKNNDDSGSLQFRPGGSATNRTTISTAGQLSVQASAGTTVATFTGNYTSNGDVALSEWQRSGGAVKANIAYADSVTSMEFGTTTSHAMRLKTANAVRIMMTAGGNIGINELSPQRQLHVDSGSANIAARFESSDGIAAIEFKDPSGTAEVGNIGNDLGFFPAGTEKMRLTSSGHLNIASGRLQMGSTGIINKSSATVKIGDLDDNDDITILDLSILGGNQRIYLDDGNIFINGTSNSNAGFKFDTSHFHSNGDVIAYSSTLTASDRRLKENIQALEDPLNKVLNLQGVKYDWKEEGRGKNQIGLIAQEVEEIVPEVVNEIGDSLGKLDDMKAVSYTHLTLPTKA